MQIRILKLNYSKTTNIYTMGLCVLYYVEYSLYDVKKSGIFLSGLELHFKKDCCINPLPHVPILGYPHSAANKELMSKIYTNRDPII